MKNVPLVRLTRHLLSPERYDVRVRPILDHKKSLKVHISISLYQIIEVVSSSTFSINKKFKRKILIFYFIFQDEPSQNIKLNVWMIQKWRDEYLDWNPNEYGMINSTIIPFHHLWIPDTYLYNSVKMSRDETERYMNIQATSNYWKGEKGAELSFLYPAIYTITCRLNIRFFPYDRQNCTLTISSWTNSKSALDYYADTEVSMQSFIPNEEWQVKSFKIHRHEVKIVLLYFLRPPNPSISVQIRVLCRAMGDPSSLIGYSTKTSLLPSKSYYSNINHYFSSYHWILHSGFYR